jgi:catechol 2,3-dioxygenase-like lactoylglutathione lyase family enzyme
MIRFSHTIVFVRDMRRSVKFYRDTIGLPLRFESPEWSEFATGSCNLALHKAVEGTAPQAGAERQAGHCHVGFTVTDLDDFHARMQALEVRCLDAPKIADFGGRLAVYADPDGLPVSVTQEAASSSSADK